MASKNTQPTGIDKEKVKARTEKLAAKLFPKEAFNAHSENIKIAEGRKPINKHQKKILEKEIEMAEIAERFGHYSILLPEKSSGKNCDSIMDGVLTEFKEITGSEHKIQDRFGDSLKQGVNSFLKIDRDFEPERIRQLLHGKIIDMKNHKDKSIDIENLHGTVYIYLTQKEKMYKWSIDSLK